MASLLIAAAPPLEELRREAGPDLIVRTSPELGTITFLRASEGRYLARDEGRGAPKDRATAFIERWGSLFGLAARSIQVAGVETDALGQTHVRLEQVHRGLPVFGGELLVHMDGKGIFSANGVAIPAIDVPLKPAISTRVAETLARAAMIKERDQQLQLSKPALHIFRSGLIEGREGKNHLAYRIEATGTSAAEVLWIDAADGRLLSRWSLRPHALHRVIYSPVFVPSNPSLFVQRQEGGAPSLLPPINKLYDFAGQTYNFFSRGWGRDSYDGAGASMRSVYLINQNCPNAYWDGSTTNYCPTFDVDDVVAHEWGHAYTQHTHGLVYAYQSGALNEAYSDIWGETVDLTNGSDGIGGANNSAPHPTGQRWLIGEDVPVLNQPALGILRDMWTPSRFGDPDRVTAPEYYCDSSDGGGVHTNSGIPNHAYAMLIDGKTFNGQTVAAIGFTRATHIYYRAMTVYQHSSTNFAQHADALEASCADLLAAGSVLNSFATGLPSGEVVRAADCEAVARAMLAVEMRTPPVQCGFTPLLDPNTPAMCAGASSFYTEDWESGLGAWTTAGAGVTAEWPNYLWTTESSLPEGRAGSAAFAIDSTAGTCAPGGDYSGTFSLTSAPITIPAGGSSAELRFDHYVETEAGYDGGNLLVSVDGGAFTLVPQTAYLFNAPASALSDPAPLGNNTNPKAGQLAWHGADGGQATGSWGTTIVNLSALAGPGQSVRLMFDFGIDGCNGITGWYVDTIEAHTCP